ncbi:MAG: hypothetical protein WBM13_01795 [Bacteroidia bacterium]
MKKIIFFSLLFAVFLCSCKSKQKAAISETKANEQNQLQPVAASTTEQNKVEPKVIGKVSHEYQQTGCATVVVITKNNEKTILIPKDKLPVDLDIDGQEISFYYRTLKMPQPAGCIKGMPAALRDIEKVKR